MNEWLIRNQKPVLYIIILLFLGLASFYLYQVKPLQAHEAGQERELQRVKNSISDYEVQMAKMEQQFLTEEEARDLLAKVPIRPNVEQMVANLERTELETEIVIQNIGISISPNEGEGEKWKHILPEEVYTILEEKVTEIDDIQVSYVEMTLSVEGEEENVHSFVDKIENLERITHIQSYSYTTDEETEEVSANITIRSFYTEDFTPFIEETEEFELDYEFNSTKIKSYLDAAAKKEAEESTEGTATEGTSGGTNTIFIPVYPEPVGEPIPAPTPTPEPTPSPQPKQPVTGLSEIELYYQPSSFDLKVKADDTVFYVVQTGGYNTEVFFMNQLERLMNAGIYPRTVVRDYDPKLTTLVIHTGFAHNRDSADKLGKQLESMNSNFRSWVDEIPFRLPATEQENVLPAAHEAVTLISVLASNGLTNPSYKPTDVQVQTIEQKVKSYETLANEAIQQTTDEARKVQLQDTITFLKLAEKSVKEFNETGKKEVLWSTQGALLDFVHTLNGYERY